MFSRACFLIYFDIMIWYRIGMEGISVFSITCFMDRKNTAVIKKAWDISLQGTTAEILSLVTTGLQVLSCQIFY